MEPHQADGTLAERTPPRGPLFAPPVYRRFLAGGVDSLRPSRAGLVVVLAIGVGLVAIRWLCLPPEGPSASLAPLTTTVGTLATAIVLVLLTTRWLGSRLGTLTGLVWLTTLGVLGGQTYTPLAATLCLALGLFAAAEVPGRLPPLTHRATAWAFYGVVGLSLFPFGSDAAVVILATCLGFLLVSQNARSLRFLLNPVGLGLLGAAIVGRWALGPVACVGDEAAPLADTLTVSLATGTLPWLPLAVVAVVAGLRQGHYAAPFWRLVGCWTVVAVGLGVLGTTSSPATLAALTPPVCVMAAAGLTLGAGRWARRPGRDPA